MAWWNRQLFGGRSTRSGKAASRAAIRCMRIRSGVGVFHIQCFVAAWVGGKALFVVSVVVGSRLGTTPGFAPAGDYKSALADLSKSFAGAGAGWLGAAAIVTVFILLLPSLGRHLGDRAYDALTVAQLQRARRQRAGVVWMISAGAFLLLSLLIVTAATANWAIALLHAAVYGSVFGVWALLNGLFGRDGKRLACVRCGYPMRSWRAAPSVCPECGNQWRRDWRHTIGQRRVTGRWVGIGIVSLVAAIAVQLIAASRII